MIGINEDLLMNVDPDLNIFNKELGHCGNYTIENFSNSFVNDDSFSILNFNIRSFHRNKQGFESFLQSILFKFDVIVLSETWNSLNTLELCFFDGYNSHHTYRADSRGGGISVFTCNSLKAKKIPHLCLCTSTFESCVVKVCYNSEYCFIIGVYRPPSGSVDSFLLDLEDLLNDDMLRNKLIVFTGDINLDLININSCESLNYINLMYSFCFFPIIDKITRCSNEDSFSGTNLDHIYLSISLFLIILV